MVNEAPSQRPAQFAPPTPESPPCGAGLSPGLVPSASSTPGPGFAPVPGHSPGSAAGYRPASSSGSGSGFGRAAATPSFERSFSAGSTASSSLGSGRRPPLSKRASLFVWVTLQSIPTETVVSPHILDFLDQLFELLPMTRGLNLPPPSPESTYLPPGGPLRFCCLQCRSTGGS